MDGFDRFAQTLQEHTQNTFNRNASIQFELGTITSALGLKVSRFDTPIPKGDYLLDKRLSINYKPEIQVTTASASNHSHTVKIPLTEGIARIQPDDRVLVCWVGDDPIIIAVVANSDSVGEE